MIVVRQKLKLDEREAIEAIRKNAYVLYFDGFEECVIKSVSDRRNLVAPRYRLGTEKLAHMTGQNIISSECEWEAEVDGPGWLRVLS